MHASGIHASGHDAAFFFFPYFYFYFLSVLGFELITLATQAFYHLSHFTS
jgi:hypothetical protein